jgi:hypothetical protein
VVEVYIDPDGDGKNYIEVEVNPINTIFDLWLTRPWAEFGIGHSEWNFNYMSAASSTIGTVGNASDQDTSWTCEMALPFDEMGFIAETNHFPPVKDDVWRFNLYRFDRRSTNDPNKEETGWNQTGGGQHVPDKFGKIIFDVESSADTAADHSNDFPDHFALYQNYPNPFNPSTRIAYTLPEKARVKVELFDTLGRRIQILLDEEKPAGNHVLELDGQDLASGIYFYRIQADHFISQKKMVLSK